MSETFLGKWTIRFGDVLATYKAQPPQTADKATVYIWPNPPGNSANIAFILRDGKIFLLVNDGQYLGYWEAAPGYQFLNRGPLEDARGFTFPGQDPRWLPTTFTSLIQCTDYDSYLKARDGTVHVVGQQWATQFTMTQVTPTVSALGFNANGDGLDYTWVDFSEYFFSGTSFQRTDFSNCQFNKAQFWGVDLTGAILVGANLQGALFGAQSSANRQGTGICSLAEANLSNCNLTGASATERSCDFTSANFTNADLTNASFAGCPMTWARLLKCNLTSTNLSGCNLSMSQLTNCNLSDTDLSNADLSYVDFTGSTFTRTKFFNPLLASANLSGADLTGVIIDPTGLPRFYTTPLREPSNEYPRANLAGCRFNQSLLGNDWSMLDLTNATILNLSSPLSTAANPLIAKYAILKGVHNDDFSNFSLPHAVFDYAKLDGFNFNGADLTGASFKGASLRSASFSAAKLSGANFDNADLTGAEFADADLTLASFQSATLSKSDFSYATLDGANFYLAQLGDITGETGSAATLSFANMRGTTCKNANFDHCALDHVQWYGDGSTAENASMQDATFASANLAELNLKTAHLQDAVFTDAVLIAANLNGAVAIGADFTSAHLPAANFTSADLTGAHFAGASVALEQGVPLFELVVTGFTVEQLESALDEATQGGFSSYPQIVTAFKENNYPLNVPSAKGDRTQGWVVSNKWTPPAPGELGAAWAEFKIFPKAAGTLGVYGYQIWITQVKDQGQEQTVMKVCLPTILEEGDCTLSDDTQFPNGKHYRAYQQHIYTWEEMMTPPQPLTPPTCVAGQGWGCKPNKRTS